VGEKVELSVQSDLGKIISDLQGLQKKAQGAGDQIKRIGSELDKNLQQNTKRTESHFERLRDLGRRVADQLKGYFSNLADQAAGALNNVKADLGMTRQFKDATRGAVELHDVIRKIGGSLGIANDRLVDFQQNITAAFSQAGFGAGEMTRSLQGLAGTQVEGEDNVMAYALKASQLAQNGGQAGQEGEIAKALAGVQRARGIDQNDTVKMAELAEGVRGRNPLEKLEAQKQLYGGMDDQKRREIGPDAMRGLQAVAKTIGPEMMGALIGELTEGKLKRIGKDAQGLGGIIGAGGVDFDKLEKSRHIINRIGFDKTASAGTAGLGEEASKALVMLFERFDAAKAAQARALKGGGDLETDTRRSRGLVENAAAVKNQVGGVISGGMAPLIAGANDIVGGASKSKLGSAALMGGGYAAAGLGAFGLSTLSKSLGGKLGGAGAMADAGAKMGIMEQVTGQKTIPVYVVNIAEMSNGIGKAVGSGLPGGAAGGSSLAQKAGVAALGLEIGVVVGTVIEGILDKKTQGTNDRGFKGNVVERTMSSAVHMLAPLLEPLRSMNQGIDDLLKADERATQEIKQRKLEQSTSNDKRGSSQGATK
jgi:hypothetical protein